MNEWTILCNVWLFDISSLQNQVVADDKSPTAIPSDVQLFEAFSMQIANIVQVNGNFCSSQVTHRNNLFINISFFD